MIETDRDLSDLLRVGPKKPIGYLGFDNFDEASPTIKLLIERQLYVMVTYEPLDPGAFWIWAADLSALDALLRANIETLFDVQLLAHSPIEFVAHIATHNYYQEEQPALYRLIGLAFADKRFTTS